MDSELRVTWSVQKHALFSCTKFTNNFLMNGGGISPPEEQIRQKTVRTASLEMGKDGVTLRSSLALLTI